jgi:hypothetical protein
VLCEVESIIIQSLSGTRIVSTTGAIIQPT